MQSVAKWPLNPNFSRRISEGLARWVAATRAIGSGWTPGFGPYCREFILPKTSIPYAQHIYSKILSTTLVEGEISLDCAGCTDMYPVRSACPGGNGPGHGLGGEESASRGKYDGNGKIGRTVIGCDRAVATWGW